MLSQPWRTVAAFAFALAVGNTASAAPLNSHYETDLDNYRVCKPDEDGNVLGTCVAADVRSPSRYYLAHETQGSITFTGSVVKLRIDDIRIDDGTSFACQNETVDCESNVCPITGAFCGGPTCTAPACQGGPKDGKNCNTLSPDTVCKNLDNVTHFGDVVFHSSYAGAHLVNGNWAFKLFGDASSPATGCTKVCAFGTLNDASPSTAKVDSNSLSCQVVGDCNQQIQGYQRVTVVDGDGNILAIPSYGEAFIQTFITTGGDPAKVGDACRGGSPPADCP